MDKKNTTIGVILLLAAMGMMIFAQRQAPPPRTTSHPEAREGQPGGPEAGQPGEAPAFVPGPAGQPAALETLPSAPASSRSMLEPMVGLREGEQIISLSNDFAEVRFTNYGGAIAEVVLQEYPTTKRGTEPTVLNAERSSAALSLLRFPGADDHAAYTLVSQSRDTIEWRATIGSQLEITRRYTLSQNPEERDPYNIRHETIFRNLTDQPLNTPALVLSAGTAAPVDAKDMGLEMKVGAYNGKDADFTAVGDFVPGWFARTFRGDTEEKRELSSVLSAGWVSVKNQFFASVLTPDQPGVGVVARRVQLPRLPGEERDRVGLSGRLLLDAVRIEPGTSQTLGFDYYSGPKEYSRLEKFSQRQDLVMDFGFFGFFSKLLLWLMRALYENVVANWGWAIVGTTLIIRTLLWPLTAAGARSAKRMAKIQGPMKELQEKYKDNRQKLNEEMLKLFRQHKVNPVGGCLPLFVQLPIFFGLFTMLRSASELRFAEFLWVQDLSAADTVANIPLGFMTLPLNIMPLLMGASMVVQMRMTPTPMTDNAQAKMMKLMPYMITAMCYTFSSGLAVYWTASNLFSIFQQWVTNRSKDPADLLPKAPAAKPSARPAAALPVAKKKRK